MAARPPPWSTSQRTAAYPPAASQSAASPPRRPFCRGPSHRAPTLRCLAISPEAPTQLQHATLATVFTPPATPARSPFSSHRKPASPVSCRFSTTPHPVPVQPSRLFHTAICSYFAPASQDFRDRVQPPATFSSPITA